jgi:hypothetical protein
LGNGGVRRKYSVADDLCLAKDVPQMILAFETLDVDLVDGFGAAQAHGKPSIFRGDLDPANRRVVSRLSTLLMGSPASTLVGTYRNERLASFRFCSSVAAASTRSAGLG